MAYYIERKISRIYSNIESIWHEERLPEDWNTALVCPIHKKKNDPQECSNYTNSITRYNV